ncbi:hypothetical protein [Serratia fonticola]|uniref:hypothetical protein n=1 Tax=Serratia fonticola TaxID=47917 RepID=UPI0021ADE333|nr:hypothetical protein [Serratia fonticola]
MEEIKFIGYISHAFRDSEEPVIESEFSRLTLTVDGYLEDDLKDTVRENINLYRAEIFHESCPFLGINTEILRSSKKIRRPFILTFSYSNREEANGGIYGYFQNTQESYRFIRIIQVVGLLKNFHHLRILHLMQNRMLYLYNLVAERILSTSYKSKIKHVQYIKSRNINLVTEPIGQGALSRLITSNSITRGLFDVGHGTPITKNVIANGTYRFEDRLNTTQVIFLSHWDEDHFQLATHFKFNFLLDCYWYFPFSIDVIKNGSPEEAFDYEPRLLVWETILKIIKNNKFMAVNHESEGQISLGANKDILYACGKKDANSNDRGIVYILRTQQNDCKKHVFIPGDADYQVKDKWLKWRYTSVIASHHGSKYLASLKLTPPKLPIPANKNAKFVFSFGFNDHYKHPSNTAISVAQNSGYTIHYTSCPFWQYISNKHFKLTIYNAFAYQVYHFD